MHDAPRARNLRVGNECARNLKCIPTFAKIFIYMQLRCDYTPTRTQIQISCYIYTLYIYILESILNNTRIYMFFFIIPILLYNTQCVESFSIAFNKKKCLCFFGFSFISVLHSNCDKYYLFFYKH